MPRSSQANRAVKHGVVRSGTALPYKLGVLAQQGHELQVGLGRVEQGGRAKKLRNQIRGSTVARWEK